MADPLPDTDRDIGAPRWVKLTGIVAVVAALLVIVMLLTGHGPWHHMGDMPMGGTPTRTSP
jgi:hypothetical protein